jgi:hypothetical protein
MAAEDLARALIRLDNPYVRAEVAAGDFASFEEFGFELSGEERELLVESTMTVPIEEEVATTLVGDDPRLVRPARTGGPGRGYGYWTPATARAIEYVRERLRDPQVQASFAAWQDLRGNKYP